MGDLISRYKSGDCQAVRDALKTYINLDSSRDDCAIASAVADEFVSRAVENLCELYEALQKIGYQFSDPQNAFVLNDPPDDVSVCRFEVKMGRMPLLASCWYRKIRSLDFSQSDNQFTDPSSQLAGLGWNTPFIVQSLEKAINHWEDHCHQNDLDNQWRRKSGLAPCAPSAPVLLTGGCASNNDCKGFSLPSSRFDDVLYNEGFGDQYFGDEIARGFQIGGFPVLAASDSTLRLVHSLYGKPDQSFLLTHLPSKFRVI